MMKPVILVAGEKESGKDTFADMLAYELHKLVVGNTGASWNVKIARFAFADPIKRAVGDALGVPDEVLWGNSAIKESTIVYGKSVRHWLQTYGTEWFRDSVAPSIWVDKAIRAITSDKRDRYVDSAANGFIISDCRFGNEFKQMYDALDACTIPIPTGNYGPQYNVKSGLYKCFVFKVWRKNRPTAKADAHRSESSIQELDAYHPSVIDNSGTLDELKERAKLEASLIYQAIQAPAVDPRHL